MNGRINFKHTGLSLQLTTLTRMGIAVANALTKSRTYQERKWENCPDILKAVVPGTMRGGSH